jgi:hypothetical protein
MILASLASVSLVFLVSVDSGMDTRPGAEAQMSLAQKNAAMRPLVRSATECVVRSVADDPRFAEMRKAGKVNDLIVDSMSHCADAMRAMIDGYDRYFGAGSGENFFMGPYLDVLPTAVNNMVKDAQ